MFEVQDLKTKLMDRWKCQSIGPTKDTWGHLLCGWLAMFNAQMIFNTSYYIDYYGFLGPFAFWSSISPKMPALLFLSKHEEYWTNLEWCWRHMPRKRDMLVCKFLATKICSCHYGHNYVGQMKRCHKRVNVPLKSLHFFIQVFPCWNTYTN